MTTKNYQQSFERRLMKGKLMEREREKYKPKAKKLMPNTICQVLYKSLNNCWATLHEFNSSYAS